MWKLKFCLLFCLFGCSDFFQVSESPKSPKSSMSSMMPIVSPPWPKEPRQRNTVTGFSVQKQPFRLSPLSSLKRSLPPKLNLVPPGKQIQRREVPFQQAFLGVPVQVEKVQEVQDPGAVRPSLPRLPPVRPLVRPNETEAERAERIHRSFDRLLTFVEIVGQVDNYVSSKWKNLVKTVSNFYEEEDDPYRVSSKRLYGGCPHAHAHGHTHAK